jgi:pSer/pThr/pTyr-binding forkhead associated (FHA) protein
MRSKPEAVRPSQPALLPLHGFADKKPRPLDREALVVGRARGADVPLEAPDVSHLHCVISRTPQGWYIRDCNSRAGTRINGETVKGSALMDGDILQVGPFSFTVQLPESVSPASKALSQREVDHLQRSRKHLGQLALTLRKRLGNLQEKGLAVTPTDLNRKASGLKEQIRTFDHRLNQLEEAERELVEDREALEREREAHQARVHHVEKDLGSRLQEVEAEIRQAWQDFQQRCRIEEFRLGEAARTWKEQQTNAQLSELQTLERQLAQEQQALEKQKQEIRLMLEQINGHRSPTAADPQSLARVEASLQQQRQDLARMMADLEKIQQALHVPQGPDLQELTEENQYLRSQLRNLEERLSSPPPAEDQQLQALRRENEVLHQLLEVQETASKPAANSEEIDLLNQMLRDKEEQIAQLQMQLQKQPAKPERGAPRETDLEAYEAELNKDRQQLEKDRAKLNAEIDQLRFRNAELDEAVREMEMEMSRERAELARERMRLDRLREEARLENERMQREGPVRESLVNVNKLREEMTQRKQPAPANPLNDRLKNFRNKLSE